mmetsp:Transcript_2802/g.8531  ORF Transcript_2802/g.8531 Transcript_2802/m.8531 type:complete len:273 (+) Transcript_2802:1382-2200(+)
MILGNGASTRRCARSVFLAGPLGPFCVVARLIFRTILILALRDEVDVPLARTCAELLLRLFAGLSLDLTGSLLRPVIIRPLGGLHGGMDRHFCWNIFVFLFVTVLCEREQRLVFHCGRSKFLLGSLCTGRAPPDCHARQYVVKGVRCDVDLLDFRRVERPVVCIDLQLAHADDIEDRIADNLAKDGVFTVEPLAGPECNEELGAVAFALLCRHRHKSSVPKLQTRVQLVRKRLAKRRLSAIALPCRVSSLYKKIVDDAVENAVVVTSLHCQL